MPVNNESSSSFPIGETAQEKGLSYVPKCYQLQPSDRPKIDPMIADVPVINLGSMMDPVRRPILVQEIADACRRYGFFQVMNHEIPQRTLDRALSAAGGFFDLPTKDKAKYISNDVHKPVRYGSSLKDGEDKVQFWRVFLKHYAHPLCDWIGLWPENPQDYRQKMGDYVEESQKLSQKIAGLITESLGLGPEYLNSKLDQGMQVMTVNCYPPCPQPYLTLGLPPHTDYSCLTLVLQDSAGLQIFDSLDESWHAVPAINGTLQVHLGDQVEVLSNGKYKSVVHRITVGKDNSRISIAGLHTLGMDVKMGVAMEMVDEEHPKEYRESSFKDFLDFISKADTGEGLSFLNTLKIQN